MFFGFASILSQTLFFCFLLSLKLCRAADIRDKLHSLLIYCISDMDA